MSQVFISYSRLDIEFVEQLVADLRASGFNVWYDLSGLEGGTQWGSEIQKAIENSQFFILVLSPNSLKSKWVQREFLFAENCNIKVIPLQYQPCPLPMWLMDLQLIDMQGRNYKSGLARLLKALGVMPGQVGARVDPKATAGPVQEELEQAQAKRQKEEEQKRRQAERDTLKARPAAEEKELRQAAWLIWKPRMPKILAMAAVGILLIAAGFQVPGILHRIQTRMKSEPTIALTNTSVSISTEKPATIIPTATTAPTATVRPSPTVTPLPSWVADFADPILNAIAERTPDLADDFSSIQPYWDLHTYYEGVKPCSNSFATIIDGLLVMKAEPFCHALAEQTDNYLSDFVIEVDIDMGQMHQQYTASIIVGDQDSFTLYGDGSWGVNECIADQCQVMQEGNAKVFYHSQPNKVQFISFGNRNAIFLNRVPIVFYEHGDAIPKWLRFDVTGSWNTSDNTGYFDNLKIWKLDAIPGLESLVK